ncbi:MAG TPA: hypothetical protein VHA52_03100 [Candidatus Babeliaceae bacterium]|nr:hypothetical protein [Candidatus Babeliaceae bacterium]
MTYTFYWIEHFEKDMFKKWMLCCLLFYGSCVPKLCRAENSSAPELVKKIAYLELREQYHIHYYRPSDIHEHLPVFRKYAQECSSIVELGVRNIVSTWGFLLGLAESPHPQRSYIGVDIGRATADILALAHRLTTENGISFQFWEKNDMDIEIAETDLLMVDTLHTYAHLTYELEKFSPKIRSYIIIHDTSHTFEYRDCLSYTGDYSEYPPSIDRSKHGLWPAVVDFLHRHPEWSLHERHLNNNGLTVLKRRSD